MENTTVIEPRIRYATSDNGQIAYAAHGEGARVLFLGGLPFCNAELCVSYNHTFFESLAANFELAWLDFNGCGLSRPGHADFSLDALCKDVEGVASALGWEDFNLVGRNAGAVVALAWAAQFPERTKSVVAVDAWLGDVPPDTPFRRVSHFLDVSPWDEFTEHLAVASLMFRDPGRARSLAAFMRAGVDQETFIESQAARATYDLRPYLGQISAPVLIIENHAKAGDEFEGRKLAAGIRGAELKLVDDPAHEGLEREVADFIGVPNSHFEAAHETATTGESPGSSLLSSREREVLQLMATGRTNVQIAGELVISPHTVSRHVTHIFEKTGAVNRAEAARWAAHRGLD